MAARRSNDRGGGRRRGLSSEFEVWARNIEDRKARKDRYNDSRGDYWRARDDNRKATEQQAGMEGRRVRNQENETEYQRSQDRKAEGAKNRQGIEDRRLLHKAERYADEDRGLRLTREKEEYGSAKQKRDLENLFMRKAAAFERVRVGLASGSQDGLDSLSKWMFEFGPRDEETGGRGLVSFKTSPDGSIAYQWPGMEEYDKMDQADFNEMVKAIDPSGEKSPKVDLKSANVKAKAAYDYARKASEDGTATFDEALEEGFSRAEKAYGKDPSAGGLGAPERTAVTGKTFFNKKTGETVPVPEGATGTLPDGTFTFSKKGEPLNTKPTPPADRGAEQSRMPVVGLSGRSREGHHDPERAASQPRTPDAYHNPDNFVPGEGGQPRTGGEYAETEQGPRLQPYSGGGYMKNEDTGEALYAGMRPPKHFSTVDEVDEYERGQRHA